MSKIGKMPIQINEGTSVTVDNNLVTVKGPKGEAVYIVPTGITVQVEDGKLIVSLVKKDNRDIAAQYGLTRATLANLIRGFESGFEKKLELVGVGYRAQMQGTDLVLSLGFSHPVKFKQAEGITMSVAENVITIAGTDKSLVGEMAARIRKVRPPEPYKGKGIKYVGERVRRKAGKAAKAVGAAK